jgi:hypothetical protein
MSKNKELAALLNQEFGWRLILIVGENKQGLPLYYMVAVQEKNLTAFHDAQQQPHFKPEDYGVVLARGFGDEPPPLLKLATIEKFESNEWLPQ